MNSQGPNLVNISSNALLVPTARKSSTCSPEARETMTQNEMTTHQTCGNPQMIRSFFGGALTVLSNAEASDIFIKKTSVTETQLRWNVNAKPVVIGFFVKRYWLRVIHPTF